ncbi:MAG: flagellar basal body rod protein FlgC [Clostridia bacterium]|nr:flagellar basal body rod protein FlgC [Clostridia bacterium]
MNLWQSMNISASGLTAERFRIDLVASNLANVESTAARPGGAAFQRQLAYFQEAWGADGPAGVVVAGVYHDPRPGPVEYQPGNPAADAQGYVQLPNVDPTSEAVDLLAASRAYEMNATAFSVGRDLFRQGLAIGQA